jgi:light-harvesting protein B-800-850 alpha chain
MTTESRIWLVVKPTVGLPALLGGVATIAVIVHLALASHAGWYGPYWTGAAAKKAAAAAEAAPTPVAIAPTATTTK